MFLLVSGSVSLPAGMVTDQFGMLGLLTFIRAAETDPELVALALGRYNPHTLNLSSTVFYASFIIFSVT